MLLRNNYYKVYSAHYGAEDALFHVALLPGCDVYRGISPAGLYVRGHVISR